MALLRLLYLAHVSQALISGFEARNVNDADWERGIESANATGEARIEGRNITAPFPGTPSEDWVFSVRVKAEIPLRDSDQYTTGTSIRFKAPDNLLRDSGSGILYVPGDQSWNICQHIWVAKHLQTDRKEVASNCEGTLPAECIADLKTAITEGFHGSSTRHSCASVSPMPPTCKEAFSFDPSDDFDLPGASSGFRTEFPFDGRFEVARFALERHQAGNTTAYDTAIRRVYVVGHVWGYTNETRGTIPAGSIGCLRASNIQQGSRGLQGVPSSASTAKSGLMWMILIGTIVALGLV